MDGAPIFHGPIARGRSAPFALRRAVLCGLTAAGHLAAILALAAVDLLVIETMPPPRALTGTPIIFHPPALPPGSQGGGPVRPATVAATSAAAPTAAHSLRPPAPRPTVVPLPPPAGPGTETAADNPTGAATSGSVAPGMDSTGAGGPGEGAGVGPGGPGGGGLHPGPGIGQDGDPIYEESHPDITPPVQRATRAFPRYPELARKAGVQGTVILLIVIDRDGRVGEIEVLRAPDPRFGFDLAAVEAVKEWRYRPALLAGRPVAVQASVTIEFTLSR